MIEENGIELSRRDLLVVFGVAALAATAPRSADQRPMRAVIPGLRRRSGVCKAHFERRHTPSPRMQRRFLLDNRGDEFVDDLMPG